MILMYLDDVFGCAKCFGQAIEQGREVKSDLLKPGFIPKTEYLFGSLLKYLTF